jgi:Outer membrane cobalamin receptor protein
MNGLRAKWLAGLCAAACITGTAMAAEQRGLEELKRLSLDELLKLEVSTVSRKNERWWAAPSGIDVVTGDEIRRAGVQNIPDALRLATGMHVAQSSARSWGVSLRGMNVLAANKISVLMDGRSLFTPFFSGVNWESQDTFLEDIDRIEVVRGPVGALWGAFAVNGFVQILTKPAWDTQGWLASAAAGDEDPLSLSFRYGGKLGADVYYRTYAKYWQTEWTYDASGRRTQPATDFFQTGFRVDALRGNDTTATVQGDYFTNRDLPLDRPQAEVSGFNLLGRWRRSFTTDSNLEAQAYFDHTFRTIPTQFEERRNTVSGSVKYHAVRGRHDVLVGVDALVSRDRIGNIGFAVLEPGERTTHTVGIYVQDTYQVVPDRVAATFAVKGEHNTFSGFEYQPSLRAAWTPTERTTVWSAVSRAVRTPVRVDEDLAIRFGGMELFAANDDFETEEAIAWELGWRHQVGSMLTFDVSAFHYDYDHLRSTEPLGAEPLPATFKNMLNAKSKGAEIAVMLQPMSRVFLKGSYRYLDLEFSRDPGSVDTSGGNSEGNDPRHVATIGAHFDLPGGVELDTFLRHASALPNPAADGYTTVDVRLGWRVSSQWEIAVSGRNLLDAQHVEFVTTNSLNEQVPRRWLVKATWRY